MSVWSSLECCTRELREEEENEDAGEETAGEDLGDETSLDEEETEQYEEEDEEEDELGPLDPATGNTWIGRPGRHSPTDPEDQGFFGSLFHAIGGAPQPEPRPSSMATRGGPDAAGKFSGLGDMELRELELQLERDVQQEHSLRDELRHETAGSPHWDQVEL